MKKFLDNLHTESLRIRMSDEEKSAMRARVLAPLRAGGAPAPMRSPLQWFMMPRAFVPALALLVVVGGGTVSAAGGALPGDLLYPVKLSINEKVEEAFAQTPVAKAKVQVAFAERRLMEAEALASRGKLSADASAQLESKLGEHTEHANALAIELETEDPASSAEIKTALAASLNVHSKVLAAVGGASADEGSKERSQMLAARAKERAGVSAVVARTAKAAPEAATMMLSAPAQDAAAIAEPEDRGQQKVAAGLQLKAAEAIAEVRKDYEARKHKLSQKARVAIEAQLSKADTAMSLGSASVGSGAYLQAVADFTKALQVAVALRAAVEAEEKYNNDILDSVLEDEYEGEGEIHADPVVEILIPAL